MTDWEFVFDGVVGFLTSPMWNMPIVSFIEKHCIVFDTSDENMLALTEIHKEYSSLVEELLTSYLKDVGISEEQFVMACEAGSTCNDQTKVADRSIFEQVWAGEDFELFKSMMVKKNLDLELQALHMIQQRNGVVPKVFESEIAKSNTKTTKSGHQKDEEQLLKEVIKLSEEEYKKEKERKKEIERMEKSLALSSKEESERLFQQAEDELRNMERMVSLTLKLEASTAAEKSGKKTPQTESPRLKEKTSSPKVKQSSSKSGTKSPTKEKTKSASPTPVSKESQKTEPTKNVEKSEKQKTKSEKPVQPKSVSAASPAPAGASKSVEASKPAAKSAKKTSEPLPALGKRETPADAANNWLSSAMAEAKTPSANRAATSKTGEQVSIDDQIAQRAQYMRMQREKLLNLKKQERTKCLNTFEEVTPKRPMSSRVARRVTAGTEAEKPKADEVNEQQEKKLALRRALAARLKKEVINAE